MSGLPDPRVVVDASVLVDLLAGTDRAPHVRSRLADTALHAPAHLDAEVVSALARLHRAGAIDTARANDAVDALTRVPLDRHPLTDLVGQTWAHRDYLRITDAFYVALAEKLHMPLLTTDPRLARAYPKAEPHGLS
jgi:predicted nucleic acid-binding protein